MRENIGLFLHITKFCFILKGENFLEVTIGKAGRV